MRLPRLSPDGRHIGVSVIDGSRTDVWKFDLDGGGGLKLTTANTNRRTIWSPDGTRIAFFSVGDTRATADQDLFVMPSAGGEPSRVLPSKSCRAADATTNPKPRVRVHVNR